MTGFALDFEETFEGYDKIEDGTYEVIIQSAQEDAAASGTVFTNFTMVVRNDVQQKYQNQKIWHRVWKAKETGKYNMLMFNTIGKAAKLENGKRYMTMDDLLNDFFGKPLKITVKNETSEYNGKTYENLNVKVWAETAFPNVQHQWKDKKQDAQAMTFQQQQQSGVPVTDDDLPF